jgi:gliding motility-associated-like protein
MFFSAQEDINGLTDGQYVVQVTDSTGLTAIDTVMLSAAYQITTIDTIADALCYSASGTINLTPQNGIGFYMGILTPLSWDAWLQTWVVDSTGLDTLFTNIDTTNFVWSVPAGNYSVIIIDNLGAGCAIVKSIVIHQPSSPVTLTKTFSNNICKGDSSGWISVTPDGGTPPYTFVWSVEGNTGIIASLIAGLYSVTVSDNNGCLITETTEIEEPFQPLLLIPDTQDVSCRDNHDGFVKIIHIENGQPPYSFLWSSGDTLSDITSLDSGYYSLTVTDAKGCTATRTFHIGMNDCGCIIIYNVITPNADGKNDTWKIKNIELYPQAEVKVFNRWGTLVFSKSNGYDNSWDGKYNGKLLDSGDYYYVVILNARDYPPYTGPLKILK